MIKNIVLTGGWGYGNLGDDAIMIATIKLLDSIYPDARLTILTYNIAESEEAFPHNETLTYAESLDRKLFGDHSSHQVPVGVSKVVEVKNAIMKRFGRFNQNRRIHRLSNQLQNNIEGFISIHGRVIEDYKKVIEGCDLFIISGGGYINDWIQSVASKYLELYLAKHQNCKCIICGITFGPFLNKDTYGLATKMINMADGIFVRDKESFNDIQLVKDENVYLYPEVVPDIALSDIQQKLSKKNQLVFIPFNNKVEANANIICDDIIRLSKEYDLKVIISVSQQWYYAMQIACKLYCLLKKKNCDVEMIIPSNVHHLQKLLSESELTISQNLHGLIMSYRAGTDIICLNNTRKFSSFIEQAQLGDYILLPEAINPDELFNMYSKLRREQVCYSNKEYSATIKVALQKLLNL